MLKYKITGYVNSQLLAKKNESRQSSLNIPGLRLALPHSPVHYWNYRIFLLLIQNLYYYP